MSNQVTGRVYIRVGGLMLESKSDAKLTNFAGVERKAVIGNTVHGYSEEAVAPSIECKISHKAATSLKDFASFVGGTVQFECDTGTVYQLNNAWLENAIDLSQGEADLKFTGTDCVEVRSA